MCEEKKPKINDRDVNALQIKKKKIIPFWMDL